MMTTQTVLDYCLAKPCVYFNTPFAAEPICARIGKRIFAEVYPSRAWVTLRCDPIYGLAMREIYPDTVRRGYYCPPSQQPHHNTVTLDGTVPDDVLRQMIDLSYESALKSLTRAERAAALAPKE
jgi:predicted DNA-binding protein (MmcQ/YjbR family)